MHFHKLKPFLKLPTPVCWQCLSPWADQSLGELHAHPMGGVNKILPTMLLTKHLSCLLGQLCPVMGRSSSRATAWTFHSAPAPAPPVQYAQSLQVSNPAALCGAGEGFFPLFPLGPPKSFAGFNTKFHHNFIQQFNNCGTSAISEMDNSSARGGLNRKFIPYLKARIKLSGVKLNCVSIEPGKQRSVGALGHPGCASPRGCRAAFLRHYFNTDTPKSKAFPTVNPVQVDFFFLCSKGNSLCRARNKCFLSDYSHCWTFIKWRSQRQRMSDVSAKGLTFVRWMLQELFFFF